MKFDEVTETDRLLAVESPVAEGAELVGDFVIHKGRELVLTEEGTHIRLVGLKHPLLIARTYPLTFRFEKAGTVKYWLTVDFLASVRR